MKIFQNTIITALILIATTGYTQENDSIKYAPIQVSFAYPLALNGINSFQYTNNFSLNILYGVNGGVNGFEIGSLVNILKGNVNGGQVSGIANINQGSVRGAQLTGIYNLSQKEVIGAQIAGIANLVTDSLTGIQISGISNISRGNVIGAQINAISNIAMGEVKGAQISVIHNLSTDTIKGAQISVINNTASAAMHGVQVSLINYAKELNGFQLGLINISDSSNGVSLGLLNFVKTGYHAIEIYGNEVFYTGINIKLGTKSLYNIYSAGFQPSNPEIYGVGIGLGSNFNLAKKLTLSSDLTVNYINESTNSSSDLNLLNRLDLTLDFHFNDNFSVLVGPSYNVHVSNWKADATGSFLTNIAVNPFYTEVEGDTQIQMWLGGKIGLRYTL